MMIDKYWNTILSSEKRDAYINTVQQSNKDINGFIQFDPQDEQFLKVHDTYYKAKESLLARVPFAIKNNIAIENVLLSCASRLLSKFISPITASAVVQLLEEGLVPVGITNMDEFGMGSDTTNTIYGVVKNPWALERTMGGSSGGSAAAVASSSVPFALGSDTGGSIRQPASFGGLWGLKPTYGSISRYGLVAFASSLDVIGMIAEHPKWLAPVFEAMRVKGKDIKDASAYYPDQSKLPSTETKKIGMYIPNEGVDKNIQESMREAKAQYEKAGYQVLSIDLPIFEYSPAVYMNIAAAEASANLARFDGIRYGDRGGFADNRLELINNARNNGFGNEVKLRVITGGFVLRSGFQDQYYLKAQKLRRHIQSLVMNLFKQYDLIVLPVSPTQAFKFSDESMGSFQQKLADAYSVVANLSGIPAVSYPVAWKNNLPVGIQAMAPQYAERRLFKFVNDTYNLFEYQRSPYAHIMYKNTSRNLEDM